MNTDNTENMIKDKYGSTLPLDLEQAKKSNILISGTNQVGKSLTAMAISDKLMREQWQILAFDNVGHWKRKSSIPLYYMVSETTQKYILPKRESMIYDISNLLPINQKEFCEWILSDLWKYRIQQQNSHNVLVLFEEFQLYAKNVRGNISQNILRIMSVGANHGIRCLGITPDLSLIDCAFIRLAQQRYHFRLGNEPNAKRRFRAYYGLDWCRIVRTLEVGYCLYVNVENLEIRKIPLFRTMRLPQPYREPQVYTTTQQKGMLQKLIGIFKSEPQENSEETETEQQTAQDEDEELEDLGFFSCFDEDGEA